MNMTKRRLIVPMLGALVLVAMACVPPAPPGPTTSTTTTTAAPLGRPTAIAGATPTVGDAPLTVTFDSSGSLPGTGTDLTYSWDFGDGSPADTTPAPSHLYLNPGTFQARLTLTNSLGTSTSAPRSCSVTVSGTSTSTLSPLRRKTGEGETWVMT